MSVSAAEAIDALRAAVLPELQAWMAAHRSEVARVVGDAVSRAGAVPVRGTATTVETRLWPTLDRAAGMMETALDDMRVGITAYRRAYTAAKKAQGLVGVNEWRQPQETAAMLHNDARVTAAWDQLQVAIGVLADTGRALEATKWRLENVRGTGQEKLNKLAAVLSLLADYGQKPGTSTAYQRERWYNKDEKPPPDDAGYDKILGVIREGVDVADPGAVETLRIAGYPVVLRDYRPEVSTLARNDSDFFALVSATLTDLRRKIDRHLPGLNQIIDRDLVFRLQFGPAGTEYGHGESVGGYYVAPRGSRPAQITLLAQNLRSLDKTFLTSLIVHEVAHHLYAQLPARVREDWDAFTAEKQPLNLRLIADTLATDRVLAGLRGWGGPVFPYLRAHLPADEFIRLEAAATDYTTYGYGNMRWTVPKMLDGAPTAEKLTIGPRDLPAAVAAGLVIPAPKYPITRYGHTNPDEAIAEALGHAIGYGPRAVLPAVFSMLQTILQRYGRLQRNPHRGRPRRGDTP